MPIELRLLQYFAVVAEERHVGHAAARLFISQPALSQQIRALEEQVGVPLFVRHPRGMELTEAGEALLLEARQVLASSDRLEAAVEELGRGHTESLRLGLPPGLPPGLLPELLAALRDTEPAARVEVRELTTPEQLAALDDGTLDLGLVREPVEDRQLSRRTLLVEPLGVSLPAAHRLAERSELTLRELAEELFVCFPRAWAPSLHDVLVTELREQGIQARFQDSAHLSTTEGMVAAGLGITLSAPPWLDGASGIVWRPLSDVQIEIRTAAAWRTSNRSPLLKAMVDILPTAAAPANVSESCRSSSSTPPTAP
ncbi:MAG TPA: LysR family transcriptional regulator [Thermoleophilaceae bacterium]|nr:LysR family transcriptional regulator [Thermoleophilaceae bacterium]